MQWISKLRSGTFLGCPGALFKAPVTLEKIPFSVWVLKLLDGVVLDRQLTQHKPSSEIASKH